MPARLALLLPILLTLLVSSCATSAAPGKALAEEYYNLGNEWFDLKKYDKAAKAYQSALSWNPELRIATVNLARSRAELGDTAGALDLLETLANSDPDNLVVLQYRAWLTGKRDGLAASASQYAALAERLPGDAPTLFNAGLSLRAADRPEEALRAMLQWKELDGKGWAGLSLLAELLEGSGSDKAADAWLEAAGAYSESDPRRFGPLSRRAKALERAELFGEAVEAWNQALALSSTADQARGEAYFRRGSTLLLHIEDYQAGSQSLVEAWKAGFIDPESWKKLREDKLLKFSVRLEADLKLAGVTP